MPWLVPAIGAVSSIAGGLIGSGNKVQQANPNAFLLGQSGLTPQTQNGPSYYNFGQQLSNLQNTPMASAPYTAGAQNFLGQEQGLANQLQTSASGGGPSLVQPMVNQQREQNIQQAMALAGSQAGRPNVALTQRLVGNQVASANAQAARDASMARLQEIFNARQQLGQVLAQGQQGNVQTGQLAMMDENQRQQLLQNIAKMGIGWDQSALNAAIQQQQINAGIGQSNQANTAKSLGGAMAGIGSSLAFPAMTGIFGAVNPAQQIVNQLNPTTMGFVA